MRTRSLLLVLITSAVAAGCGPRRYSPIEVSASDFDTSPLVGRWTGSYSSPETGRSGSIVFTLQAGEGSASGDIVMVPAGPTRSTVPLEQNVVGAPAAGTVRELLTVRFVRKEGGKVTGMLDAYRDPDCSCRVTTVFEGHFVDSGKIEGTFKTITVDSHDLRGTGTWDVRREKRL